MASPFVRRRRLAAELRTLREARGMTADQLAKRINQSRMKISRLENAHGRPDLADLMKILEPGVLQTPEFTWSLVQLTRTEGTIDYVPERMAEARLQRQRQILRAGGPAYEIILDEIVIRRIGVPPDVLTAQLRHLAHTARTEPNIALRLLPADARVTGGLLPKSPFFLYTFADAEDPPMAVVDTVTTDLVHTDPDEVLRYTRRYDHLRQACLAPEDTVARLTGMADDLLSGQDLAHEH